MIKNKRGWIRIVEAFIAIMLITGVLLVVINKGYVGKADISGKVYEAQLAVLREIELNETLRKEILSVNFPVKWDEFDDKGLTGVKDRIETRIPEYLTCEGKICKLDEVCSQDKYIDADIYAQSVAIAADLERYSPRQLKLFCWAE